MNPDQIAPSIDLRVFNTPNTLMIQGCTSDAGKSVMVAGLCRWLARQKIKVAPLKPQNMALNSAVTIDNGEIGRAQAVQAQACNLQPHTDMNPILLKPSSDTGAQIIVHGRAIDSMRASQYHDYKKIAMQAVLESHSRLAAAYQSVVVEGAGSPAEINLRENDIANMGFAEAIDCPVVLIADIDRGGVFAHLVGTLELLSKSEQHRIVGFIINRFRGDVTLLEPGLHWLQRKTGKPVIGVVPYLPDFFLDAEDAIANSQIQTPADIGIDSRLNIVVPVLPRISNHTDFDALRLHPAVNIEFVSLQQPCPPCDLIILPGSKNVIDDLTVLKQAGWQLHLDKHLRYGGKIMGICGGYQMLGQRINDPHEIESTRGYCEGFGYLDIETTLEPEKRLKQTTGKFRGTAFNNAIIEGYEIHCGVTTESAQHAPLIDLDDGLRDGIINSDNSVLGTYLHGLFDLVSSSTALLAWAGLQTHRSVDLKQVRERQLDRLADCLDEHLDSAFLEQLTAPATLARETA